MRWLVDETDWRLAGAWDPASELKAQAGLEPPTARYRWLAVHNSIFAIGFPIAQAWTEC